MKKIQKKDKDDMTKLHIDDKFLQEHLNHVRDEMSWRRELEFRLLQFLVVFYPIIGTAIVALYQRPATTSPMFWLVVIGASFLIIVATVFVTKRIKHEHLAYAQLGKQVQKVWTYFGLFEPGAYIKDDAILPDHLRDPNQGYGQGQGYKRTIGLIWLIAISMVLTLIALAIIKSF